MTRPGPTRRAARRGVDHFIVDRFIVDRFIVDHVIVDRRDAVKRRGTEGSGYGRGVGR
jgi:hypothetical protein